MTTHGVHGLTRRTTDHNHQAGAAVVPAIHSPDTDRPMTTDPAGPGTIAEYWMSHGYSRREALQLQREIIAQGLAEEELYEAMDRDVI